MKINYSTIRSRLNIMAILLVLFYLTIGIFGFQFLYNTEKFNQVLTPLTHLQENLLNARKSEKDFYIDSRNDVSFHQNGTSIHIDNFNVFYREMLLHLKKFQSHDIDLEFENHVIIYGKVTALHKKIEIYYQTFKDLTTNVKQRGFKSYGLIGQWKKHGDKLRRKTKEINILQLKLSVKSMKDKVVEYLLWQEEESINELIEKIAHIKAKIKNNPYLIQQIETKINLQEYFILFDKYAEYSRQLSNVNQHIGINLNMGLLLQTRNKGKDIGNDVKIVINELEKIAKQEIANYKYLLIIILFIIISVTIFVIRIISVNITKPVDKIKDYIGELSKGKIPQKIKQKNKDEIREMLISLNTFIDEIKEKVKFAQAIGKGELDTKYTTISNEDVLGLSLIDMQKNLKNSKIEEQKRKEEEKQRNWTTRTLAEFDDILRQNNNNLKQLSNSVMKHLIEKIGTGVGGIFLLKTNAENYYLELLASYAYDREKYLSKKIEVGEGIVGTVALEKKMVYMTQLPLNYIKILSGLGKTTPQSLIIMPLIHNEELIGVLELATLKEMQNFEKNLITEFAENLASTLSNTIINEQTNILLEQSKEQTEVMTAQEEEMRQNLEELQTTQEELGKRELEMKGFMDAIDSTTYAVEYDLNGDIIKVNDFVLKKMSGKSENEIIGTNHRNYVDLNKFENYNQFWNDLKAGKVIHSKTKKILNKKIYWFEETYTPIYDSNGKMTKILNIAFDVTKSQISENKLKNEKQELHKSLTEMEIIKQAIDQSIIHAVYNPDGKILEINDKYIEILGYNKNELIGNSIQNIIPKEKLGKFDEQWKLVLKGKRINYIDTRTLKDGSTKKFQIIYSPYINKDNEVEKIHYFGSEIL